MARKRATPDDLDGVAEAVAEYSARKAPQGRRGMVGKTEELTPREARFVEATVLGAPSQLAAATIAGYSDPQAQAYAIAARPKVQKAIEDRRSELQQRAGVDIARVWRQLESYALDTDKDVRSSAVRSAELLLRGAGELDTRVTVTVDARTGVLPAADPGQASAALERMFVDAVVLEAADGGGGDDAGV